MRLLAFLDPEDELEALHPAGPADLAHIRLAAAAALLRLARAHDARLPADGYLQLALVMQVGPAFESTRCLTRPYAFFLLTVSFAAFPGMLGVGVLSKGVWLWQEPPFRLLGTVGG